MAVLFWQEASFSLWQEDSQSGKKSPDCQIVLFRLKLCVGMITFILKNTSCLILYCSNLPTKVEISNYCSATGSTDSVLETGENRMQISCQGAIIEPILCIVRFYNYFSGEDTFLTLIYSSMGR